MRTVFSRLRSPEAAIVLIAVVFRIVLLDVKPPHFDEGVNGWFADQMTRQGSYHYDPTNYHGPLHFYAVFLSQTLFGRNLWALRLPAVLAAVAAVAMTLAFRRFVGVPAARLAGLAMAVSPAFVFYGRYSIHESWQVLFAMVFAFGLLGLWTSGSRRDLILVAAGVTGMVLTKETYILHIGSTLIAVAVFFLWDRVVPSRPPAPAWVRRAWTGRDLALAAGGGAALIVFFYSGTFLHWSGLHGLYETHAAWFKTGVADGGHQKTAYQIGPLNWYWIALMARYEWPALLGLAACARFVFPSAFAVRWLAILGGGVLLAYSLIPYKTPWCVISILWPFLLVFGSAAVEARRRGGVLVALLAILVSAVASVRLNAFHATDEKEPYVYVQTYPEIAVLTGMLLDAARDDPRIYHADGQILLDSYYPLPWMLGDFTRIGYYKPGEPPDVLNGAFVVVEANREQRTDAEIVGDYIKRRFRLRDAQEECVVYFRRDMFGPWLEP